jgi:hypothetical protein
MIIGAHSIIYSREPESDRAFIRDILRLPNVDAGDGWLIFGLPPAVLAVHPSRKNNIQVVYLMCADIQMFVTAMAEQGVFCGPIENTSWGQLTQVKLPGGGKLGVYEPRHARPQAARPRKPRRDLSKNAGPLNNGLYRTRRLITTIL